jgi:ubiquinone/menaquinone biosynthesis C-methylase UbiE
MPVPPAPGADGSETGRGDPPDPGSAPLPPPEPSPEPPPEPPPEPDGPDDFPGPSMLDLVRLSPRNLFPPGGRELYRRIALLTGMAEGQEVLVAACGPGVTLEYFVREFGVHGSGVDEDPELVARIEARARSEGNSSRMQAQQAPMGALPYRDGVFDVAVAEPGLTARTDPATAIREVVRVVRTGGRVVLVQLVWRAPVDPVRRQVLARHLGAQPLMTMEVKKILRDAGVRRLHTEAWTDAETSFRGEQHKPFPDFAELFTLPEKLGILRRAWRRWGWRGVREAMARELEVHRLLTRERILGLDMISGIRMDPEEAGGRTDAVPEGPRLPGAAADPDADSGTADAATDPADATDLFSPPTPSTPADHA